MSVGYEYEDCNCHPWCSDPARDEAVRMAEDGRQGALPTLEEAIAAITQKGNDMATKAEIQAADYRAEATSERTEGVTERRPVDAGGGGNVTGLRAELESSAPAASGAAGNSPAAYGYWNCVGLVAFSKHALGTVAGCEEVPLYRAPQPALGWLTAEERAAIQRAISEGFDEEVLRNLLVRSSPPEVVLPRQPSCPWGRDRRSWDDACLAMQREYDSALAAAGVTVKEVGK